MRTVKPTLVLKRETLVQLTPENLQHVVGGFTDIRISGSCCLWTSCKTMPPPKP
ncbi:MAG: hypothetical protein ABI867_05970 [Kofleriaceae bacterium]